MGRKVCVFGGSGFLGLHLVDALLDSGFEVTVFDNSAPKRTIKNIRYLSGDILNEADVVKAVGDVDIVYNLAALADLNDALNKPIKTAEVNIIGNLNILESCRRSGVKRIMYASTVYVSSKEGGFYKCSKQSAESYVKEYKKAYDLDFTIMRYGSLYGPNSGPENGLYRIVKMALETQKIIYRGDYDAIRQYIHVEDAAKASVAALDNEYINQTMLITGQESLKIMDTLKMISEILGLEKEPQFIETKQVGHYVRTPYSFEKKTVKKYTLPVHVDFGQGLLDLMHEIKNEHNE